MEYSLFIDQLDSLITTHNEMVERSKYQNMSDIPLQDRQSMLTRTVAAIHRIAGLNSTYSSEIDRIIRQLPQLHAHIFAIIGIAQALRDDLKYGYIQSLAELVNADVFADFLEMAQHLCDSNYKDPSAVLAGSTLESHLRKMALKYNIPTSLNGIPIKADKLNSDLAKALIYSVLDQKNITAWLDLRNKAAHGKYDEYTTDQVKLLISGIREFIARNPA